MKATYILPAILALNGPAKDAEYARLIELIEKDPQSCTRCERADVPIFFRHGYDYCSPSWRAYLSPIGPGRILHGAHGAEALQAGSRAARASHRHLSAVIETETQQP